MLNKQKKKYFNLLNTQFAKMDFDLFISFFKQLMQNQSIQVFLNNKIF